MKDLQPSMVHIMERCDGSIIYHHIAPMPFFVDVSNLYASFTGGTIDDFLSSEVYKELFTLHHITLDGCPSHHYMMNKVMRAIIDPSCIKDNIDVGFGLTRTGALAALNTPVVFLP